MYGQKDISGVTRQSESELAVTKALVKSRKVRGSIVVSIPKEVTEQEGIGEGELVEIDVRKARKDWFGSLKGVGKVSKEDELDAHD